MSEVNRAYPTRLGAIDSDWRPIESAPKDGTEILLFRERRMWVGSFETAIHIINGEVAYRHEGWWSPYFAADKTPSHWMPLPSAPEVEE